MEKEGENKLKTFIGENNERYTLSLNGKSLDQFGYSGFMVIGEDTPQRRLVRLDDYLKMRDWIESCGYLKKFKFPIPVTYYRDVEGRVHWAHTPKQFLYSHEIYPALAELQTAEPFDELWSRVKKVRSSGAVRQRAMKRAARALANPDDAPPCGPTTWRWKCDCDWCIGAALKAVYASDHECVVWKTWVKEHLYLMHLSWMYGILSTLPVNIYRFIVHLSWAKMVETQDFEKNKNKTVEVTYVAPARLKPTTQFRNGTKRKGKVVPGSKKR